MGRGFVARRRRIRDERRILRASTFAVHPRAGNPRRRRGRRLGGGRIALCRHRGGVRSRAARAFGGRGVVRAERVERGFASRDRVGSRSRGSDPRNPNERLGKGLAGRGRDGRRAKGQGAGASEGGDGADGGEAGGVRPRRDGRRRRGERLGRGRERRRFEPRRRRWAPVGREGRLRALSRVRGAFERDDERR